MNTLFFKNLKDFTPDKHFILLLVDSKKYVQNNKKKNSRWKVSDQLESAKIFDKKLAIYLAKERNKIASQIGLSTLKVIDVVTGETIDLTKEN